MGINIVINSDDIWDVMEGSERFRQEIDKLVEKRVQEVFKKLNYAEPFILGDEAAKLLGCSISTLASYRSQGMPYTKSSPNKYLKTEILAWQEEHKKLYRKICRSEERRVGKECSS